MIPMRWLAVLWLLAGCDQLFGLGYVDPTTDAKPSQLSGYHDRKKITVSSGTNEALFDIPISVVIEGDPDLSSALMGGGDLAFTSADGATLLEHEIVKFDRALGDLQAWVRIPRLSSGPNDLYLYYNGPPTPSTSTRTWSDIYAAVWHLGTAQVERDSTAGTNQMIPFDPIKTPGVAAGIDGDARTFDGIDDELCVPAPDGNLDLGLDSFGISVWVNTVSTAGESDAAFARGATGGNPGVALELGAAPWLAVLADQNHLMFQIPIAVPVIGIWTQIAVVYDRKNNEIRSYSNGERNTDSNPPLFDGFTTGEMPCIGSESGKTYFQGQIDEVKLYRLPGNADGTAIDKAIMTELANLGARSRFVQVGKQEPL